VLNILGATVTDVTPSGTGQALVGLSVPACQPGGTPTRLLSRISQASAVRLGVVPGLALYAQVKGVAMVR